MKKIFLLVLLLISLVSSSQNQRHNGVNPNTTYTLNSVSGPANFYQIARVRNDTVIDLKALKIDLDGVILTPTVTDSTMYWSFSATTAVIDQATNTVNNSGTSETDLHTFTVLANRVANDDESVEGYFGLTLNDLTGTATLKVYFAGTLIFNSGALTVSATGGALIEVRVIRSGTTTARAMVTASTPGASTAVYAVYTALTGLDWTVSNVVKVSGQAGGASGGSSDISAVMSKFFWYSRLPH